MLCQNHSKIEFGLHIFREAFEILDVRFRICITSEHVAKFGWIEHMTAMAEVNTYLYSAQMAISSHI